MNSTRVDCLAGGKLNERNIFNRKIYFTYYED